MALWLVRAGRHGEREDFALENNVVVIGWDGLKDLSAISVFVNKDDAFTVSCGLS